MKARKSFSVLTIVLILISHGGPATWAISAPSPSPMTVTDLAAPVRLLSQPFAAQPNVMPVPAPTINTPQQLLEPTPPPDAPPVDQNVPQEIQGMPGATSDWWAAVQEQIRQDMYAFSNVGQNDIPSYTGSNSANNFEIEFVSGAVRLTPSQSEPDGEHSQTAGEQASWTWELEFTGYGYQGDVQPVVAPIEMMASDNHVTFQRDGISEWYLNDERGLEQGFSIQSPPFLASMSPGLLVLEMTLDTNLTSTLSANRQSIEFAATGNGASAAVLRYTDLYVFDADGRELPAHMELGTCHPALANLQTCTLRLVIDDANAVYPIIIDPLVELDDEELEGKDAEELGYTVATAGDVNGDGYDDFIVGAPDEERAYIYYGSADFSFTDVTTLTVEEDSSEFGSVVGTAGDVNNDGYADVFVGAPGGDDAVYVWHGRSSGVPPSYVFSTAAEVDESNDQVNYNFAGTAGDVNADGYDDFIVGSDEYDSETGKVDVYYGSSNGLASFDPDWTFVGETEDDYMGRSVGAAGDVNGDGYDDIIVGAPEYDIEGSDDDNNDQGKIYVFLGSTDGLEMMPAWTAQGEENDDFFGSAVGTAGDVNGDGYADVIIGAPGDFTEEGDRTGHAYVHYGSVAGTSFQADWEAAGEVDSDGFGFSIGTIGDVNGDGYDDVIVGAPGRDTDEWPWWPDEWGDPPDLDDVGKAYAYLGSANGLQASASWEKIGGLDKEDFRDLDEDLGDALDGAEYGFSVGAAGDVNGDGYNDFVVGAPYYNDDNGKVFVYFGDAPPSDDYADWRVQGTGVDEGLGWSVSTAGDVNGDGYGDVIVGAYGHENGTGHIYVYPGTLTGLLTVTIGTASGENAGDEFGWSVGTVGDVNGDGYDDVIVGAPGYDDQRGRVYVYLGTMWGVSAAPAWVAGGENHDDRFGDAVGTAGYVNQDNYADIIVGAKTYPLGNGYGKVYVYYGTETGLGYPHAWSVAGVTTQDNFGDAVGTAGDINADGFGDLIIGAPGHDDATGRVAVYYGSKTGLNTGPADWEAFGESPFDHFGSAVGTAGDVDGDGKSDVIVGAPDYGPSGKAYVYYGTPDGLRDKPSWTATGESWLNRFGWSVGTAGDVDGDGDAEIIVGAPGYYGARGRVYLYEGSQGETKADLMDGWPIAGSGSGDSFGFAVAAGDVNGDGYGDIVAGAPGYDAEKANVGHVSVYHGSAGGLGVGQDTWSAQMNGYAVGTAGDVNGDDYADVIVGADTPDGKGLVAIYHGSADGLSNTPSFSVTGNVNSYFGRVVGTAGQVNDDMYDDIVIGAPGEDKVYVFYGSATGMSSEADWEVDAVAEETNRSYVGTAGKINGDNYDDLIIGNGHQDVISNSLTLTEAGIIHIYYGGENGLDSTPALTITGKQGGERFGSAVAAARDLNDDNYADIIIGAPHYGTDEGKVYVYYGNQTGISTTAWSEVAAGDDVCLGRSVGAAGDVNGDTYGDVIIGAGCGDADDESQVYVYYWDKDEKHLSGDAGWDISDDLSSFGKVVGTAGDVNKDGYDDVVVSVHGYDNDRGQVRVYYGSADGLSSAASWIATGEEGSDDGLGFAAGTAGDVDGDGYDDLIVGTLGISSTATVYYGGLMGLSPTATGENAWGRFGHSVGTAGDLNGDGYSDVVIGAPDYDGARGQVYVYYGGSVGHANWTATGENEYNRFGHAVAAGDVNGDGYSDLVVGAPAYDVVVPGTDDLPNAGRVYVYYGNSEGLGTAFTLAFTATGKSANDEFGRAVAAAGDVNGDGYSDVIVGAPGCGDIGKVYVYYGSDKGLSVPSFTVTGESAGESFGRVVAAAGDVNGDGYSDVIVGAPYYDGVFGNDTGKVYVYHGSDADMSAVPAFTASGESADDQFGHAVAAAGDVNGDGYSDVIVGAPYYDASQGDDDPNAGKVYVYHGSVTGLDAPFFERAGNRDDANLGIAVGTAGDVDGDGYSDIVVGVPGDTAIHVYHGSLTGITADDAIKVPGENMQDRFGNAVGTAGDVDGDGYADIIVGAPEYNDSSGSDTITATGKVYIYRGNDGGGQAAVARQMQTLDNGVPVQPWGATWDTDAFRVSLQAAAPLGRDTARLQVQACWPGVPFGDATCLDYITPLDHTDPNTSTIIRDVTLDEIITVPNSGDLYRWRARAVYGSPLLLHSPWRRFQAQALEADLRVMVPSGDLYITKTMQPIHPISIGHPITFVISFSNTFGGPASGVIITDVISADDLTNIQIVSSGAAITDTSTPPVYRWEVQDLDSGESGVITITGNAATRRLDNAVVISSTRSHDNNPKNNDAFVNTIIPGVIYVDRDAPGANNGTSWFSAYTDLQDALKEAGPQNQIWVAEGDYFPTSTLSDRQATFALKCGVKLYGGFVGFDTRGRSESHLHERDWASHRVILSGDIGVQGVGSDNVYHVVSAGREGGTVDLCVSDALIDGFIISGGWANGDNVDSEGGGMRCNDVNPTLRHITFVGNRAYFGGGLYIVNGNPTLFNVAFSGNHAIREHGDGGNGGGLFNESGSHPQLLNVTFSHNQAAIKGGGIYMDRDSLLTMSNGILWGNGGSQISHDSTGVSTATITYSDIQGNGVVTSLHNIDANPMFYDANGADDDFGTPDDDLRLRYDSPVIDMGNGGALFTDTLDMDNDGITAEAHPFDITSRHRVVDAPNPDISSLPVDMGAYEFSVLDVLDEANALRDEGVAFRMQNLQLLPADTLTNALMNYTNFNDGEMFYDFCADYGGLNDNEQYCPGDEKRLNIRNKLVYAVELYHYARNWPTADFVKVRDNVVYDATDDITEPVHEPAENGMRESAQEIGKDHTLFGHEFLVDATDYRFSTNLSYADEIIASEIKDLELAAQQFQAAMSFLSYAYNEMDIANYLTNTELEIFGNAAQYLQQAMAEWASRLWKMGKRDDARAVYLNGAATISEDVLTFAEVVSVISATAALSSTEPVTTTYLTNGSWSMLTALSTMRQRAKNIEMGLDFFGFAANYAPRQSYDTLLELMEGPTGNTGLLATARDLEDQAREYQRTYDANASAMSTELDNLTWELSEQLFDLCGESADENGDGFGDYGECDGGLFAQNQAAWKAAHLRIKLANERAKNAAEQIRIEQERAEQVINLNMGLGREFAAAELAIGVLEADKYIESSLNAFELNVNAGIYWEGGDDTRVSDVAPFGYSYYYAYFNTDVGYHHSDSMEHIEDPNAEEIGEWESKKALQEAIAAADIEGVESQATVRNLLLQEIEALIEAEIAVEEFNQVAAEHNHLLQRWVHLLNQRKLAIDRVTRHNSHLTNPAYRIWRDTTTTQSNSAFNLTAQYAYMTARAAEYEMLTPYPALGDVFKARTTNDIRLFLNNLKVWYLAVNAPGALNRYPYALSLRDDLLLTLKDEDEKSKLLDYAECEIKDIVTTVPTSSTVEVLECTFSTLLDMSKENGELIFSPNIWGNRISGIGMPLGDSVGVSANLVTTQTAQEVGQVEIVLIHDGVTTYRRVDSTTAIYDVGPAAPLGCCPVPNDFIPESTTVVLRPSVNGEGEPIHNGGLVNLSVTAASWTLRIREDANGDLNWDDLQDIVLYLDTTGRSLPNREPQAMQDATRLQAGQPLEAQASAPRIVTSLPSTTYAAATVTKPDYVRSAPSGQIGGSYFGNLLITDPVTAVLQSLDLDLVYHSSALSGTITGTVRTENSALYSGTIALHGVVAGGTFTLTSDVITSTRSGRDVQQQFTLNGYGMYGANVIVADYTAVITGLLPNPFVTAGSYSGMRARAAGSDMLWLDAARRSVPLGSGTTLTAILFDHTGTPLNDTVTLTLVGEGSLTPATVETGDDGQALVTFSASETEELVTIIATTGTLTDTVSIDVRGSYAYRVYLPVVFRD